MYYLKVFHVLLSLIICMNCQVEVKSNLPPKMKSDLSKELAKAVKLPPCQACKILVESFQKGLERTERGKFEGGDTAWEEERLGSYANSELRLIEIQEKLCLEIEQAQDQCHALAEETESLIEDWWFQKQQEEPDLYKWLCISEIKRCCPDNHYGSDCAPCQGYPDNVCSNNGKCKGTGTRKGNGKCKCDDGYRGDMCNTCAPNFYEAYRDDKKLLCSPCHSSCNGACSQAGNKGCVACKGGWTMHTEKGCVDLNECHENPDICRSNQFCVNNEGSYSCLACDKSCDGCDGDGPDMCKKCAKDFDLENNMCVDKQQKGRNDRVNFTRYMTYLGLCVATCIILQRNTIVASLLGLFVAFYITVSEYWLASSTKEDLSPFNFGKILDIM